MMVESGRRAVEQSKQTSVAKRSRICQYKKGRRITGANSGH